MLDGLILFYKDDRMIFKGDVLQGVSYFGGDHYLNSITVLFDRFNP